MRITLICRWREKNNKPFVALLAAGAALAMATLVDASTSPQVQQLGPLAVPRTGHAATVLADGRVLITGGRDNTGTIVAAAEIFDPATQTSTVIAALNTARVTHTATLLLNGQVLIAGGTSATGSLTSAEIFDPANPGAGFQMLSATMGAARAGHTATLLNDGTVLIAGGDAAGTAEIFDPTTETFSSTLLTMAAPRIGHTATLFSNNSVLLAGGNTDSMELFTPADQKFTLDSQVMSAVHTGQEAISLSDTRLFFFGGDSLNTIEEFNPSADTFTIDAMMAAPSSSATLLANGNILVLRADAAGLYAPNAADLSSAFTAFDETSVPGSSILLLNGQTATELPGDKTILVAGGANAQSQLSQSTALFNPARIWTDKDDYQPGDNVILSGSGWKPNENVYLYAVDDETEAWTYGSTETADANGAFVVDPYFIVQLVQLGAHFSVSAVGAQSALQADVKFTDSKPATLTVGPPNSVSVLPGGTANYTISVTFNGNGNSCTAPLSITGGLPAGVGGTDITFTPSSVTNTGPTTASLAIATHAGTAPGTYTFTVLANGGACTQSGTATGTGVLVVAGSATHFSVTGFPSPVAAGTPGTFTVTALDSNNNTAIGFTGTATFSSSDAQATFASASYTFLATDKGVHTFNNGATLKTAGTQSITATDGGITGTQSVVVNAAGATKLALSGSTADLASGSTRVLTAIIQDANGNTVTSGPDSTLSVTFAKTGGTGTVTGLGSSTAVAGVATLTVTGAQAGSVTITASATGSGGALTAGTGNPITFNVVASTTASKLALSGSTADLTSGNTRVLTATIQDTGGNTITSGPDSTLGVTFAKTSGTGTATGLGLATASAGVATITVTGNQAGSITIGASATGSGGALAAGTGNPITFNVVASTTVDHFSFATINSPQTAGTAFSITITALDAGNNTVTSFGGGGDKVTLTSTGALSGAPLTSNAFVNGVLTQNVTITNTTSTGFTITATGPGSNPKPTGTSNSFNVVAGAAAKLAFIQQPTTTTAGQTITPAITVQIQDTNGNLTNSTASVSIAILNNPSSGTLSGTTPVSAVSGTATFSDLSIDKGGTGYTLQALSTGLTSATSSAFTINNPAPTLTSIAPTSGNLSQTLDVVFNGTNYIQGVSSVSFADANITVNTVTVNSSIKLTANITIGAGATIGQHNASVTNAAPVAGTATATLTNAFTVNNPATSTAVTSSLNPSTYGDSVTFTATVSSASASPTGSVSFVIDGGAAVPGTPGTTTATTATWTYTTSALTVSGSPHSVSASFTHTGAFADSNGSLTGGQTVNKATPTATLSVTNSPQTYTSSGLAAVVTVSTSSVPGTTANILTGGAATKTNAGTYAVTADFVPNDTTNYNTLPGLSAGNFVIQQATPTAALAVSNSPQTYNGSGQAATVSITTSSVPGTTANVSTGGAATQTNAGTYAVTADFVPNDTTNYKTLTGLSAGNFVIQKATPTATLKVTNSPVTYNGNAQAATVAIDTSSVSGTTANVSTGGAATQTNTGTYAVTADFVPNETSNYKTLTGLSAGNFVISKATATVVVTPYTSATTTYDGHAHTATVTSITGVNGETGAIVGAVDVTHTTHTSAGTYATDYWFFTGGTNYNDIGNTTITDSIGKATATVVVTPYTSATTTYDGNPHTATITSITGVNSETGATVGTVDVSHTTNTNAGTYASDYWFFTGTANYNNIGNTTITDSIGKANATFTVTPYTDLTTTYDGNAHTATVSTITGVHGETGATVGAVDVSHTTNTNAGTYASDYWLFTGTANYNDIGNTTITDSIGKANATFTVTPYTDLTTTYDGNAHMATVSTITGVHGETGATVGAVDVSHTTHIPAGTYASDYWFFTGTANYNDIGNTTIADSIGKANATIVVTPYTNVTTTYDGHSHTATITSITGVNSETGVTVGTVDVSHTTNTNAGTYASDYWFFTGTANYNDIGNTTITDSIGKATATVVVTPYTSLTTTYDGHSHTATITSITGVNSETGATVGTVDVSHTTNTNAGTYASDYWFFTGTANYNNIGNTMITDSIKKAVAVVVVNGYSGTYDGFPHGASDSVTGVDTGGAALGSTLNLGGTFTNVPGGIASWTFSGGTNYTDQSGSVPIVINKVHLTVTADNKSKTYNGAVYSPFTATLSGFVNNETDADLRLLGALSGNAGFTGNAVTATSATPGSYTITPTQGTLTATNYDFAMFVNGTLTINKAHLTVTADAKSVQYSDPLPTFTATLSGFANNETDAGLRSSGGLSGNASFTTAATITFYSTTGVSNPPGTYMNAIIPSVGSLSATNYDFPPGPPPNGNFVKGTLTVTQEDARATYTGDMFVSTATPTATTATVTLRATIQDITAVPTDPSYDPYPGVITNATVTFVNRDLGNAVIAANLPVTLIGSDAKTGTASFSWTVSLGSAPSVQYNIGIIVNGYHTDNSAGEDTIVTVSQLTPGSINGGGYLVVQSSAGAYAGSAGMKNNFGFNVQNTKTGVKGNINAIIRSNGHIYQIKGNSMTSLYTSIPPSYPMIPSTGTFNGKATIQDVTNPNAQPISLDGNATLQVTLTDYSQPTKDTIGITVWSKTGVLDFSSNWNGAKTLEQTLGGGNLVVH